MTGTLFDLTTVAPSAPPTASTCPGCGGDNDARRRNDPRCSRCIRAGVEVPSLLSLAAGTIHTPATIADDEQRDDDSARCSRCPWQGADHRPCPGRGGWACMDQDVTP